MPEHFDLEALRARQAAAREAAATELDEPDTRHLSRIEIAACQLCDDQGYTPSSYVCDHREHYESTANGRAAVQAELEKIRKRRGGAA